MAGTRAKKSPTKTKPKRSRPQKTAIRDAVEAEGDVLAGEVQQIAPIRQPWHDQIDAVLRQIPGFDPWALAGECGAYVDYDAALAAINWFADNLKHVEGSARGDPFILRGWQAAIVGNLFGWKRVDAQGRVVRRFRKSLIYVPRGNGKTPLAAGIVLYSFLEDGEPGAQCYLAAGAREQAGFLFRNANGMLEQAPPEMKNRVRVYAGAQHRSLVLHDDQLSFCKVIPADAAGQHGGIPHITVVDELHVQESRDLLDVFETGMAKQVRAQPLLVMITTADFDRVSVCNEVYAHAVRVRDNGGQKDKAGFDPYFLPVIYEAGQRDDWRDPEVWKKANPNINVSVSLESMAQQCRKAEENPIFEGTFRRLHLNQRTKQENRLMAMETWEANAGKVDLNQLLGKRCYAGIDLSSTEDLSAISLVFPNMPDDEWWVLSYAFCPEDKIRRRAGMTIPYDIWAEEGHITATPGNQIDYTTIFDKFCQLKSMFDIVEVGIDPAGATQFAQELMLRFGAEDFVYFIPQTHAELSTPTKEIIRRAKLKQVRHGGNPVLTWAVGNVAAYFKGQIPDGADIADFMDKVPVMASKGRSADKIDPFAALVNAVSRVLMHPITAGRSIYETRGLLQL